MAAVPPTIREATPDDAPAIAAVHVRSWQAAYRGIVPEGGTEAEYEGAPEIRLCASLACSGVFSATTQEF